MKRMMIVDDELLRNFGACVELRKEFTRTHPNGFDIGGLWGTDEEAEVVWAVLFASGWKRQIGWAVNVGLLPARIRANLRGANLSGADLVGVKLSNANLSNANLSGADLCKADLYKADLRGANLCGAHLREADLSRANLYKADLTGANLYGANLSWANTSDTIGIEALSND